MALFLYLSNLQMTLLQQSPTISYKKINLLPFVELQQNSISIQLHLLLELYEYETNNSNIICFQWIELKSLHSLFHQKTTQTRVTKNILKNEQTYRDGIPKKQPNKVGVTPQFTDSHPYIF